MVHIHTGALQGEISANRLHATLCGMAHTRSCNQSGHCLGLVWLYKMNFILNLDGTKKGALKLILLMYKEGSVLSEPYSLDPYNHFL